MKKRELVFLIIILLGALIVRLYRIDNPVADWHSWRQGDTSAVSRNFIKYGFDVLHPRFDDLSNVASGKDNPNGFRFVEFPIYNLAQAGLYRMFGVFSLEGWGRLVSIFSSLFSILFLYLLVRKRLGERVALLTALFFGLIPYNIYFGRTILPDSMMVMAILGGIYFFDQWINSNVILRPKAEESRRGSFASPRMTLFFALTVLFTASAFLLKPFALFFVLPIIYLAFEKWGLGFIKKWQLWLFTILTLSPLIAWRMWMTQFPEGVAVSDWLFNAGNIRFKGAFFQWIFADRLGRLILGYWGVSLLVLGLIRKIDKKEGWFFFSFMASSLLYIFVMARGNVQHDYYQILIIPTLAIFLAKGADLLLSAPTFLSKPSSYLLFTICCIFMFAFGWYHVRDYFNINNRSIVEAGKMVDKVTPKDAKIIAPYNGDTAFLYQTNRQGWPLINESIEDMRRKGAGYLVIVSKDEWALSFKNTYKTVVQTDTYILYDLSKKP